jgi:hypothetical protein
MSSAWTPSYVASTVGAGVLDGQESYQRHRPRPTSIAELWHGNDPRSFSAAPTLPTSPDRLRIFLKIPWTQIQVFLRAMGC